MAEFLRARELQFLLHEFLDTAVLLRRERYQDHSLETFAATLEAARAIATRYLLPHYQDADAQEPVLEGGSVRMHPQTRVAWDVLRHSGFLKAGCDAEEGGLQLPEVIVRASMACFLGANNSSSAYPFLTLGVINLLRAFGSTEQKSRYLPGLLEGESTGTMVLTEPAQGSALGDIRTRAVRQPDGSWRISGQKIYISGADHDLAGNIIHMVLARSSDDTPGVHGISLFLVPKFLLNDDGTLGVRNDIAVAGLLHKMGSRNSTSTLLNFGEHGGAQGTLVGEEGRGLACMFQMMNEARIGVGISAAAIAMRGFLYSLDYARQRPQGRLPSNKDPRSPQVLLTAHADVRRMLLAQKAYAEGALALCLYASSLLEDSHTLPDASGRQRAAALLDLLTPVVKSWPSRYGCVANDLAIQVLGGAGYMREYPVEQLYRDQRLNPIHEGAEGIHGLDLLGRKVSLHGGAALEYLRTDIEATITECRPHADLRPLAASLQQHLELVLATTSSLLGQVQRDPDEGLANATVYLDAFGRLCAAWIWLRQALVARCALTAGASAADRPFYEGKLAAAGYYIYWELPLVAHQCRLLAEPRLEPFLLDPDCL